jgi:GxxExxY protein
MNTNKGPASWEGDPEEVDAGLSKEIIGCAIKVSNGLGVGFLEKVYENALVHELGKAGKRTEQQKTLEVFYDGIVVGQYAADVVVDSKIIIELKVAKEISDIHQAQLINYLRATGIRIGLILNFGTSRLGIRRLVV